MSSLREAGFLVFVLVYVLTAKEKHIKSCAGIPPARNEKKGTFMRTLQLRSRVGFGVSDRNARFSLVALALRGSRIARSANLDSP